MSVSAAQAAAFYREVAPKLRLWTVCDDAGFPTSTNASDVEPEAVVANVEVYLKPGPGESIQ
jgi:hypothetical protein